MGRSLAAARIAPGPGAVKLTGEYNFASGDDDPADNVRGTFDQLYPTPHDKTGLADQIGWKNVHHARAGFEVTPLQGLPFSVNYHSWWLAEENDAVYNIGSAPLGGSPPAPPIATLVRKSMFRSVAR